MPKSFETPMGGESLSMQNIEAGWVIEDEFGNRMRVEEVIRDPKYDKDGVPCAVKARSIPNNVHSSMTFGGISPEQPILDWKKYKVVSKAETSETEE
jgi:hypothetical protein